MAGQIAGQGSFSDRSGISHGSVDQGSRTNPTSEMSGTKRDSVICCLPLEEGCNGDEIDQRDLNKAVHMICTSQSCDQSGFFHGHCYVKLENYLCKLVADHPQVKKWSINKSDKELGFLRKSLWTKVGHHLVKKFCRCKCDSGYLHRDLDWPPVNWNKKSSKKRNVVKPTKVVTLPKLNNPKNKLAFVPTFANASSGYRPPKELLGKTSVAGNCDIPGAVWAKDSDSRPVQGVVVKWTYQPTGGGYGQIKIVDELGSNKWVFSPAEAFINRSSCDFTSMVGLPVELTTKKSGKKLQADQVRVLTKGMQNKNNGGHWKTGVIRKWLFDEKAGLIQSNDGEQDILLQRRNINGFVNENELVGKEVRYRLDSGEIDEAVDVDILHFSSGLMDPGPQFSTYDAILDNPSSNTDANDGIQFPGTIVYWSEEESFGYISTPKHPCDVFFNEDALPVGTDVSDLEESRVLFTMFIRKEEENPAAFSIDKIYRKDGEVQLGVIVSWNIDDGWGCSFAEEEGATVQIFHRSDFVHPVGKELDLSGTIVEYRVENSLLGDRLAKDVRALVPGPSCPFLLESSSSDATDETVEDDIVRTIGSVTLQETVVEELGVAGVSVVEFTSRDLSKHPHLAQAANQEGAIKLSNAIASMTAEQQETVLDDLKEFIGCLAAHPTGHLVVQAVIKHLTGHGLVLIVQHLARDFLDLSRTRLGSDTLITALNSLSPDLKSHLVERYVDVEDSSLLVSCITDPFGARVFVASLPFMEIHVCQTVYLLFIGHFKHIVMHPKGAFPLGKFIEKIKYHTEMLGLVAEELEPDFIEVATCPNGRFVMKSLLEAGSVRVSSMVFQQISGNIAKLALSPTASTVVTAFIENAKELQIQLAIEELCRVRNVGTLPCLVEIIKTDSCRPLLSALLQVNNMHSLQSIAKLLRINKEVLEGSEQAVEFMEELEKVLDANERRERQERSGRNTGLQSSGGARPKVFN